MKRILLGVILFTSLKVSSQTIDTSINYCFAAKVNQFTVTYGFPIVTDTIIWLGLGTIPYTDDLKGNCIANWQIISKHQSIQSGSYKLTSSDYNSWDSSPEGLLSIIGKFLGITFK